MTKEEILKVIQEQFENQLGVETVSNSLTLDLAGADDLDYVEFVIEIENKIKCYIPDGTAFCRMTILEMVDYIFDEIN